MSLLTLVAEGDSYGRLFAFLPPLGSPGPPENVKVDEITDTTAQLSWTEGTDSHSPVLSYAVQARTPFSVGWQTVTTGKVDGRSRGKLQREMHNN